MILYHLFINYIIIHKCYAAFVSLHLDKNFPSSLKTETETEQATADWLLQCHGDSSVVCTCECACIVLIGWA